MTRRPRPRAPTMRIATASSFPAAAALSCWKSLSTRRRAARTIYAEVVGYGATSDGYDMVAPSGEGAIRCMQQAMATVDGPIDYINSHGTSTPAGDIQELKAIKEVFAGKNGASDQLDQVAGRTFTGRDRRARGHLQPADDATQLYRRIGQYRDARPGSRRHADRAHAAAECHAQPRAFKQLRLWWHQCQPGVAAPVNSGRGWLIQPRLLSRRADLLRSPPRAPVPRRVRVTSLCNQSSIRL